MLGQATASQLQEHHGRDATVSPGGVVAPLGHESPPQLSPEIHEPPENADNDAVSEAAHSETAPTEVHGEPTPKQEPFDIYVHATC